MTTSPKITSTQSHRVEFDDATFVVEVTPAGRLVRVSMLAGEGCEELDLSAANVSRVVEMLKSLEVTW